MVVPVYNDSTTYESAPTMEREASVLSNIDQKQRNIGDIELAVKNVERFIAADNSFPELADKLKITPGIPTRSGIHESEYPNSWNPFKSSPQLRSVSKVPIPNEIQEHLSRVHCHQLMGTFSEIRRAWLVLDTDLFLWDFEFGTDVSYYDGVSEIIITVGLVKPKAGVFQDFVHYLLALATPTNIIVLGVTFSSPNDSCTAAEEMHISPEVVYVLPTDGVMFSTIVGADNGRIFLGAKDGCLYEFLYQKEISWWGKRCQKVNHSSSALSVLVPSFLNIFSEVEELTQICVDDSRKVLYTLSAKGSIEMYDLGENGWSMTKIASLKYTTILNNVIKIMEQSCLFGPVISISPVEAHDSKSIVLIAVMESGTRIYFSTAGSYRPNSLQMAHIRMPPGYTGTKTAQRPSKIRASIYHRGTCLLINFGEGSQDRIWCLSDDLTPFNNVLSEMLTVGGLDGTLWSLEKYDHNMFLISASEPEPPLLVTQHYEFTTKFVCLTDKSSEIFQKLRPVDVVRGILEEGHDPGSEVVRAFLQNLTADEICATFLLLACQKAGSGQISDVATRGFFLYGGEPKVVSVSSNILSPGSSLHHTLPTGFNPGMVSTPIGQRQIPSIANAESEFTNQFSHKHNGLYIFLSRTMRPVWGARAINSITVKNETRWIIPSLIIERARVVINHLAALSAFIECNPQVIVVPSPAAPSRGVGNESAFGTPNNYRRWQDLCSEEKKSLQALKCYVVRTCEILKLWLILYDHEFHEIAKNLSPDELNYLSTVTFGDLILSGVELCNILISKLLNLYLDDYSSTDSVSSKLREKCPSLFLVEDAECAKAIEMIVFSRNKIEFDEKCKLLEDSLKILRGICPKINLSEVCSQFIDVGYYPAIYELCELCAKKLDPKDLALQYYRNGGSLHSPEHLAYTQRLECYKELSIALQYLYSRQANNQNNGDDSFSNGMSEELAKFQEFIDVCLSSDDEILHSAVYAWMVSANLHGELVTCGKPSLEFFLQHSPASQQLLSTDMKEILWMYMERQGNYTAAAQILYNLAKESNVSIPVEKRIHYLSHSLVCMKSDKSGAVPHIGLLYQEVEDTLRVAQIQLKIQRTLTSPDGARFGTDDSIKAVLNTKLFNLMELQEDFADPLNLWEVQLDIIDCSNMPIHDTDGIPEIWEKIVAEDLEKIVSKNPNDIMKYITEKIKSILRNVRQQSPIFLVDYLISQLELLSCKLGASKNHVHSLMTDLGVPAPKITDVYEQLYVVNSSCWEENGDEYHIIAAIGSYADHLIRNNSISLSQKKQTALKLNDLITHCLNLLYSKPTNDRLSELIRWLKIVQTKLNKL